MLPSRYCCCCRVVQPHYHLRVFFDQESILSHLNHGGLRGTHLRIALMSLFQEGITTG